MQSRKQKLDNLKSIGNQTLREITETKYTFKKYLDFNARLYKYKFEEAVLIYAQNPNATACATLNQWNKIGRRIHKGTKATPVFADEKQSQIKYLFELSNTYGRTFKTPIITKIPENKKQKILDFFGVEPISEDFNKNFKWSVEKYVEENYLDFINDFINANSKFAPTRRDKITTDEFKRTVTDCVGYVLCERFSIPKGIYNSDEHSFTELDKFNTKELIVLLGCSTQYIARSTLNEKERKIIMKSIVEKMGLLDQMPTVEKVMELEKMEEQKPMRLGKWGSLFRTFMEENHPARKSFLVMEGEWLQTIMDVQEEAKDMEELLTAQYLKANPRPKQEYLKILQYEQEMRSYIEEVILKELIHKSR